MSNFGEGELGRLGRPSRLIKLIAEYQRTTVTRTRIVILTPYDDEQRFQRSHMGSVLVWGLKRKGIDWKLHNPTNGNVDSDGFGAVLCWPYGFKEAKEFLQSCAVFEQRARANGMPVINGLAGCNFRHTWCLGVWSEAGIPCARHQSVGAWEDIRLKYPLILRTDWVHRGLNMFFAEDADDAKRIFETGITPRLDLALEFIDTRSPDGYFRKWRSHVIGNKVIPRQVQLSKTWKVNLDAAVPCEQAFEEHRRFVSDGEPHAGLVALAARALNSDIIALDYSKTRDGSYIFWEGNRNFDLSVGGQMWSQFRRSTGCSNEQSVESVKVVSDAIADLIVERAYLN